MLFARPGVRELCAWTFALPSATRTVENVEPCGRVIGPRFLGRSVPEEICNAEKMTRGTPSQIARA